MCAKWTHWAAAAVLSMTAASPALAGSATQPGDTMGSASGARTPPGFYFSNQTNWGCSNTSPRTCVLTNIPIFIWSTPWEILGGKLAFATAPTTWVKLDLKNTYHTNDLFNPWAGGQLNWDLGGGWGFTYLLGAYFDVNSGSSVAYSSTSLNQRFGLSYTADGWNLTANAILGINFDEVTNDPQGFPCPTEPDLGCNPNFFNVDLTATKRFGKWELGAVGFYATDINKPISDYRKQSKAAVGGLVGYSFPVAKLQVYATTEVHQENYGGKDTRIWSRITFPLGNPAALRPRGTETAKDDAAAAATPIGSDF